MHSRSSSLHLLSLAGWLVCCFTAAGIGAIASAQAPAFYSQLAKPGWAPPAWLFGPVWTLLYLLMAVAAWLVWRAYGTPTRRPALTAFVLQLALNALWSWVFFAWHQGGWALANIALLWLLIVVTIVLFWRARPLAAALLLPYLLWVSFASALTLAVWRMNPQLLGGG
ncbi:TspO/MBR family protein [Pulveribacter suum]|uniref:Sensory protein n=1 Tax=Pulveribacter suum TaxID=2116657 RepID=A0A2P1NJL5_9BURK|nr:TspO/MBR family protein [Pulveribacter suum]AVP57216.1 sensory protein [Pulveribacter suum]